MRPDSRLWEYSGFEDETVHFLLAGPQPHALAHVGQVRVGEKKDTGRLSLSTLGALVGWSLVIVVVGLSLIEIYGHFKMHSRTL